MRRDPAIVSQVVLFQWISNYAEPKKKQQYLTSTTKDLKKKIQAKYTPNKTTAILKFLSVDYFHLYHF